MTSERGLSRDYLGRPLAVLCPRLILKRIISAQVGCWRGPDDSYFATGAVLILRRPPEIQKEEWGNDRG